MTNQRDLQSGIQLFPVRLAQGDDVELIEERDQRLHNPVDSGRLVRYALGRRLSHRRRYREHEGADRDQMSHSSAPSSRWPSPGARRIFLPNRGTRRNTGFWALAWGAAYERCYGTVLTECLRPFL